MYETTEIDETSEMNETSEMKNFRIHQVRVLTKKVTLPFGVS